MKTKRSTSLPGFIPMCALIVSGAVTAFAQSTPLGQFEGQSDVGEPKAPGSAAYDAARQEYLLVSSGTNMWATRDQFHFIWKRMKGDFIVRARAEFIGEGVNPHRKLGWMVRPTLDPEAPYADCAEHGEGLTSLQFRRAAGGLTEQIELPIKKADVLQFERRGDRYLFSAARFGEPFVTRELADLAMGDEVYVGLFLCSHEADVTEKAILRDVRLIRPIKEGFVPYRDYIGSQLELLDVESGRLEAIYRSADPFEAPNWTRDGKALIYNTSGSGESRGRLCRFDLAMREPALIDTGFANRNNNDHVLSFSGKMIGISHHSTNHDGQSAVFTVPINGGVPKLITPLAPSYLHGWSPDGKFLIYTGGRNGQYNIYRIPSKGGQEVRLTDFQGLDDGPEYAPDGKHIYFNSTRSGLMQIWRMKPDGSSPEQVTHDDYNNWFPHISPDGKWIAFLSFSKDVAANDHPYYKQVYLRLMPSGGGAPKVIAYVYGGQGTMNVPSWSPDGKRLAFVSNSDQQ
jgi:Tol biopolymer transport system component